jgi:hypothetical protein
VYQITALSLIVTRNCICYISKAVSHGDLREGYASTHYSILTRTHFHLLVCLRRCLVEDCRLARVLPIALLNRRRCSKKLYNLDLLSLPSSVWRVSHYLWAWVRRGRAQPVLAKVLCRKLSRRVTRGLDGIMEENEPQGKRRVEEEDQQEELRFRKKELEARKA